MAIKVYDGNGQVAWEVETVEEAVQLRAALLGSRPATLPRATAGGEKPKRVLSAAQKAAISKANKERWARIRRGEVPAPQKAAVAVGE